MKGSLEVEEKKQTKKVVKANVQVDKSLLLRFTILSGKSGIARKDLIEEALRQYLEEHETE